MKRKSMILISVLAIAFLAGCGDGDGESPAPTGISAPTPAPMSGAWLRLANLSADLEGAQVRLDGAIFRERTPYPAVTGYRRVEPGSHRVRFIPLDESAFDERTVQLNVEIGVAEGQAVTLVAAGLAVTRTLTLAPFADTFMTDGDRARVRLVNAMSDFPASLELWLRAGEPLLRNVTYLEERGYRAVTRGNYPLEVRRQGTPGPLVPVVSHGLAGDATYSMFAFGTLRNGDLGALLVLDGSLGRAALRR